MRPAQNGPLATRRYAGTLDPLPEPDEPLSVSKSSVSRRWVALSQAQLHEWLSASIKELDLPVVMIDGIHFRDRVILVALGIDAKGNKHVLGLREGSTEASRVVRSLLRDLVDRGLDADRARLWVIDRQGPGGQPQMLMQLLMRLAAGQSAAEALAAPRWVVGNDGQADDVVVLAEGAFPDQGRGALAAAGLPLVIGTQHDDRAGHKRHRPFDALEWNLNASSAIFCVPQLFLAPGTHAEPPTVRTGAGGVNPSWERS